MNTYTTVFWEAGDVLDHDIDGSGSRVVALNGYAPCDEGGGHFDIDATAIEQCPYNGKWEDIDVESAVFVPDVREEW